MKKVEGVIFTGCMNNIQLATSVVPLVLAKVNTFCSVRRKPFWITN